MCCEGRPRPENVPGMNSALCNAIFDRCIADYHIRDDVNHPPANPYAHGVEALLFEKARIDTVQWHLEDLIRDPDLPGDEVRGLKRRIDHCNQERNDTVERIDDWFSAYFEGAVRAPDARQNSETPAWLVDRMSILSLKLYHWREQADREEATDEHRMRAARMLQTAEEQRRDLSQCLDELIEDIQAGRRYMKVYRQLKMYNDEDLNPALLRRKNGG